MGGLLWPESSSDDVRDAVEPADVFRRNRCPSVLVASLMSFVSVQVESGLLGGVSEVGDVVAPKPRPTRTSGTSCDRPATPSRPTTSARTELPTIASHAVDLLLVLVDIARVEQCVARR